MSITLAHQRLGVGPPLVVLHGLFGSGRNWMGIARRLAETHAVHLFDLPNHGDSPHGQPMDYPFLAACVWQTCDALGVECPQLLGHSLGGKVAMACAAQRPAAVDRLLIEDIAPVAYPDRLSPTVAALRALELASLGSRSEGDARLAQHLPSGALRRFLLHGLAGGPGQWQWRFDLDTLAAGIVEICRAPPAPATPLEVPLLVVSGGLSPYVDAGGRAAFSARFMRWQETVVAGCGHWPHAEASEAFLAAATGFLAGRPAS